MSAFDDMLEGTEPPKNKSFLQKAIDIYTGNPVIKDTGETLDRYIKGAEQGFQEMTREGDVLAEQNPLALSGTPMGEGETNAPAPEQTEEQQQALETYQKATDTFQKETVMPAALTVFGILTPTPAIVAGTAYAAKEGYEETGTLSGAARAATYGPITEWASQPDLGEQFLKRPVSTSISGILGLGQAALPIFGAYKGIRAGRKALGKGTEEATNLPSGLDDLEPSEGVREFHESLNQERLANEDIIQRIKDERATAAEEEGIKEATSREESIDTELTPEETAIKEPWQMTKDEYIDSIKEEPVVAKTEPTNATETMKSPEEIAEPHKQIVEQALQDNKPVPAEVLKEYPDLEKKYPDAISKVEEAMRQEVNQTIEPVTPAMGGSIKITKNVPKEKTIGIKFSDPEIEKRWKAASKGVQKESLISKIKEGVNSLWNKATRVYEDLPNTAEFSPAKFDLLKLEKQKGVMGDRATRLLQGITAKLDNQGLDSFTRKVILDDLAQNKGDLPFGFTKDSLAKEKSAIDKFVKNNPEIEKSIEKRDQVWEALKTDYSSAMKDIGFDVSEKINRENYFRHQVLEYANVRAITGTGEKLKTPTNRGFLKKREGSEKDINANYLQAEYEVMAQMLYDTELAKTIKSIDKNYSIRGNLFDEFGDKWRDNIPDGYTTWQPREGSSFYLANSIPESLAMKVLNGAMEEIGVSADQIQQVLAKGSPFKEMVVKQEIADTLNKISQQGKDNSISKLAKSITKKWKQFVLFGPTRFIKYELRNVTGDLDAVFTMNKDSFKYVPESTKELYQTIYGDRSMTPEMGEWFRRGGMESTSLVAELPDINKLRMFEKFSIDKTNFEKFKGLWSGYWYKARNLNALREGILRYASYKSFLKQMEENGGKPNTFAASKPEEVMALPDIRDRAFKLSNDMLGAYDNVSVLGKDIRNTVYPFWSFAETNFSRYMQFFRNQGAEGTIGTAIARKFMGNILIRSSYYAYATGSFVLKAGAFWAALQTYNNLIFPEEEKDLPQEEQERPHIILGRDADGKVRYFSRLGAFPDFLEWFGLDTPVKDVKDFLNGNRGVKQIVGDMLKSPVNKVIQGVTPTIKTPAELLYGKTAYPDAFNLKTIKDRGLQIANTLGLASEFKALSRTGAAQSLGINPRPGKPYLSQETADNFIMYKAEPNQTAYYDILDKKREFLETIGNGTGGEYNSPRSEALRNYKIALKVKDENSAAFYLTEYEKLGGNKKTLKKSLDSMDPLSGLNSKEKKQFIESLDNEEKQKLEKSKTYYKTILAGK